MNNQNEIKALGKVVSDIDYLFQEGVNFSDTEIAVIVKHAEYLLEMMGELNKEVV